MPLMAGGLAILAMTISELEIIEPLVKEDRGAQSRYWFETPSIYSLHNWRWFEVVSPQESRATHARQKLLVAKEGD